MRVHDLFEAPIGDIQTHGDFSRPGSLRADDLSLASAKRQDKIRRVLERTPITIDLHLVNLKVPHVTRQGDFDIQWHLKTGNLGYLTPEQLTERWGVIITPNPQALNLVYVQNEGDDRLPLTPWIIAHRLGHAFDYAERATSYGLSHGVFMGTIANVMVLYKNNDGNLLEYPKALAQPFGTTKACREGTIVRTYEWYFDCFAQFCVTGDVRFNPAPAMFNAQKTFGMSIAYATTEGNQKRIDQMFATARTELLEGFTMMLNSSVGKILLF